MPELGNIVGLDYLSSQNSNLTISIWMPEAAAVKGGTNNSKFKIAWCPTATELQSGSWKTSTIGLLALGNITQNAASKTALQNVASPATTHLVVPNESTWTGEWSISGASNNVLLTKTWASITTNYPQNRLKSMTWNEIMQLYDYRATGAGSMPPVNPT